MSTPARRDGYVPGGRYARSGDGVRVSQIKHDVIYPDRPRRTDALAHADPCDPDVIEAPEWDPAEADLRARAWAALDSLDHRARAVVVARMEGDTLAEVGRTIGRSAQRAHQIEQEAIARLRDRSGIVRWQRDDEADLWSDGRWVAR